MTTSIRKADSEELAAFVRMELDRENSPFVNSDPVETHRKRFEDKDYLYIAIDAEGELAGYALLYLEPDLKTVELRRLVVTRKGGGVGQRALALIDRYCGEELDRSRIWLDVMVTNARAKHVYEKLGYKFFKSGEHDGDPVDFYFKEL